MPQFLDNLKDLPSRINRIFSPIDPMMDDPYIRRDMKFDPIRDSALPQTQEMTPQKRVMPEMLNNPLDEIYKPQTEMQDRYKKLMDEFPVRQKPSFARKLSASLVGGERGDKILNEPHDRNMADFKAKADLYGDAAANESRFNTMASQMQQRENQQEIARQRLELDQLKNQQIYETTLLKMEAAAEQAQQKLDLAIQKLEADSQNRTNQLTFKQAELEAEKAQFAAQMARKDLEIANLQAERLRQDVDRNARIGLESERVRQAGEPVTTDIEYRDAEGNVTESGRRTVTKGEAKPQGQLNRAPANTVPMIWTDGKTYNIPKDKVEQARKDGFKHPSPVKRQ